ncbi:very long-chain acyl-CoA synthetase/fatty acid transporter [Rhizodiscina lignyota]|uniref:Very long-chain fatty acid transport protein n=1 Tax=Rhizodiscina lignyota TaxID=1504668 RepID=A0A9P4IQT4_9PEZI|nr:very long-chain acyl-CoA synthetase/fatty acid transporter [Rhizodiscina lignyota]
MNPLSVPATAALAVPLLAYINAKFSLKYDIDLLQNFAVSVFGARWSRSRDRTNLFYVLEHHAQSKSTADHPFLLYQGKAYTFAQAYDISLRYGNWLRTKYGVLPNEVVAMDFMNSDNFCWIWMALWGIGAKPAFINYNLASTPLLHSIRTSTARLVLVDPEVQKSFSEEVMKELGSETFRDDKGPVEIVFFTEDIEMEARTAAPVRRPDGDRGGQELHDMAILIYTSGTTGLPKPAIVSWMKCRLGGGFIHRFLPMTKKDVTYTCMPLYHSSAALLAFVASLSSGSTLALGHRFNRRAFFSECRSYNATNMQYVGETCRYLLSLPPSPDDKNHKLQAAYGNGMRPDIWNKFKERFGIGTILEFYAATEGPSGMWNKSSNDFTAGAVGRNGPLANLVMSGRISVLKLDFSTNLPVRDPKTGLCIPINDNEPGELIYRLNEKDIKANFQGYYGNKKATSSKILRDVYSKGDAWFSTGDVMRHDNDWHWYFVDRIGDTFRWKSENVSTAEVAEVLGRVEGVVEANVYGVQIPGHDGRAGCAALLLDQIQAAERGGRSEQETLKKLASHAIKSLPRYAVPVFVRLGETLEGNKTGTMKQQKTVLRDEGVDPGKAAGVGDRFYYLKPGSAEYVPFGEKEWNGLLGGGVKL